VVSALIKRLLVALRRAWPRTKIIVRADSGFCRPRVLQRLERWGVSHIIGLQKSPRLNEQVALAEMALAEQTAAMKNKQRMFGEFQYAAGTWSKEPTRASSSPIFRVRPRPCTSADAARAARPRTPSRKRNRTCSGGAPAATATRPTSFACCWPHWPTR
jgi:hypothetical protein